MNEKKCTKCTIVRPLTDFYADKRKVHDGLQSQCKHCQSERRSQWRKDNPDKDKAQRQRYYDNNSDAILQRQRQRRLEKPDSNKSAVRRWRERNLDRHKNMVANWASRNREKLNAIAREKRARRTDADRLMLAAMARRWRAGNPEISRLSAKNAKHRRRSQTGDGVVTRAEWQAIKALYDNRCIYCAQRRPLTMDHVVALSRGGLHRADNIVPACRSCNSRKQARDAIEYNQSRGLLL